MLNKRFIDSLKRILSQNSKYYSTVKLKSPIIQCKDKDLNFYGQAYGKHDEIPLASRGWQHRKSKGDYFIIHRGVQEVTPEVYSARSLNVTGLSSTVVQGAERQDIIVPTNIQYKSIHKILKGHHTLITAETGCGKTLAYLLPVLDQILQKRAQVGERPLNSPLAVILTPSRELVTQIHHVAKEYCKLLNLDVRELVGGHTKKKMLNPFARNVDLIVATPGIFSKFLTHRIINPQYVQHVVLDEADTLLDDSFEYKLSGLLRKVRFREDISDLSKAQLTLVSATVPSDLPTHVSEFVNPDSIVKIVSEDAHKTLPNIPQRFLRIGNTQKAIELLKIARADVHRKSPLMIFSNKTNTCDWISLFLNDNGIRCVSVNGDMHVGLRSGKYQQYDSGEVDVISCTDMLSRGIDSIRTHHVLNYDFPLTTFDYIHRIGRTGRIGSGNGCHVTNFISTLRDVILTQKIEKSIRKFADLPSVDGNIQKVMRTRATRNIDRAKKELMSLSAR